VTAARCAHRGRCAGAAACCGRARVSDLLMPTWVTSTTAASVLEAKETQKVMQLKLLCAEGSQRLNRGCWRGGGRASRVAVRACGRQSWAGEHVCRGATRARGVGAHGHMWRLLLWRLWAAAHERGREDAGAGRAAQGGEECRHLLLLYTGQKEGSPQTDMTPPRVRTGPAESENCERAIDCSHARRSTYGRGHRRTNHLRRLGSNSGRGACIVLVAYRRHSHISTGRPATEMRLMQ